VAGNFGKMAQQQVARLIGVLDGLAIQADNL